MSSETVRYRTGAERLIDASLVLGIGALGVAFSLQKIRSFDYWWHLGAGRLIADSGSIPRVDPFSFSMEGARWVDIHWLHQLGLYGLHALGGHPAVVLGKAVLVLLMLAFLVRAIRRPDRPGWTALALSLAILTANDRIMPRPELPTFVLLAAELALLERFREVRDLRVYAIVPLHLVWVNLHGQFAVGIGLLLLTLTAELLEALLPGRPPLDRLRFRRLLAVSVLSLLACLANPNGLEGLLYPLQQLLMIGTPELRAQVGLSSVELGSLATNWGSLDATALVAFLTLAAGSAGAMLLNLRRLRVIDVLVWGTFFALALLAVRNLALFGVAAAPLLARNAAACSDRHPLPSLARLAGSALVAAASLLVAGLVGSGWWAVWTASVREPGLGVMETLYPVGACEWIAAERPEGPIFHHMGDGGYLIWRLYPEYRVLADGRLEVYGPRLSELTESSPRAFLELDRRFHFGVALLGYNHFAMSELLAWLHERPEWRMAYLDEVSALFVRRQPDREWPPGLDVNARDLFPPLEDSSEIQTLLRLQGRARFYHAFGRPLEARRYLQELTLRYPAFARRARWR